MKPIIVVGDSIRDIYYNVEQKINPENKAPAYKIIKKTDAPGGASNVVNCLRTLGAEVEDFTLGYTSKTRIFENNKYLYRLDDDIMLNMRGIFYSTTIKQINQSSAEYVVVSDYNKGFLTKDFCEELEKTGKKLILDIKPGHINWFKHPYLIKPNLKELLEMTGEINLFTAGKKLAKEKKCFVLVTLGKDGMILFLGSGDHFKFDGKKVKCVDVTGAGDTVISVLTHILNMGETIIDACGDANDAAAISVTKIGCFCPDLRTISSTVEHSSDKEIQCG